MNKFIQFFLAFLLMKKKLYTVYVQQKQCVVCPQVDFIYKVLNGMFLLAAECIESA
jgi:hypothetical protein